MAAPLAPLEVIERTRRAQPVDAESVEAFVRAWLEGTAPDTQMGAWCMATILQGMDPEMVGGLTRALIASGDRLELEAFGPTGDVQSTGGVGDAVPLVAAPLAAALGVRVATVGDRGRAHTSGVVDKLEAIPGLEVDLSLARFVRQVRDVGIAVMAPSASLAPGERRLGALRDVTGTAFGAGLVAASITSRAVAGGAGAISLHAACGEGGLLGGREADEAADLIAGLAAAWGRSVRWTVSAIDQPLGRAVGNALEVGEAGAVLRGGGPADVRELAIRVAGDLAEAAGVVPEGEGREAATDALGDGRAIAAAERWVEAQGGDPAAWADPGALPSAPVRIDVIAPRAGWMARIRGGEVGEVARWLGVGRLHADQSIDPVVGIELLAKVGDEVGDGDPIAVIHARDQWTGERARDMAAPAFEIAPARVPAPPLILAEGRRDP